MADYGFPFAEHPLTMPEKELPRGPNGRKLCRCGCGREATPPRRCYYSDECDAAYSNAVNWNFLTGAILRTRGEVCERCGINVRDFHADYWWLYHNLPRPLFDALDACLIQEGWSTMSGSSWVNIHHIIRRADGGADHPSNLQVLCVPCHKEIHRNGKDPD